MPEDNGLLFLDAAAAQGDWAPLFSSEEDGSAYIIVQDEAAEEAGSLEQQLDAFLAGIDAEQVRLALVMPPPQIGLGLAYTMTLVCAICTILAFHTGRECHPHCRVAGHAVARWTTEKTVTCVDSGKQE